MNMICRAGQADETVRVGLDEADLILARLSAAHRLLDQSLTSIITAGVACADDATVQSLRSDRETILSVLKAFSKDLKLHYARAM